LKRDIEEGNRYKINAWYCLAKDYPFRGIIIAQSTGLLSRGLQKVGEKEPLLRPGESTSFGHSSQA